MQGVEIFRKLFEIFEVILLPKNQKWEYAQFKEAQYWGRVKPYYMPWVYKLNRFGYSFGSYDQYVNCIPLSDIIERFPFIRIPARPIIMDVGCGPSGIGFSLIHSGKTYCIDPLLNKYKLIPEYRINIFDKLDDMKILVSTTAEEAVVGDKADLVFCINVCDHVRDPVQLIKSIHDSLNKGGYLYFMVDGYINRNPLTIDPLHPHKFTGDDLRLLMERNGFDIQYFDYQYYAHGDPIQSLLIKVQNVGRKKKVAFCEFLIIAKRSY